MLREALTGRTAPGAGFGGELGRPGPVPGVCGPPFHLQPAGAVQCRRRPAEVSAAPRGRGRVSALQTPQPSAGPGRAGVCPGHCSLPFPFPTCLWQCLLCGRVTARRASASTDVPPVVTCGNKEPSVVQLLEGEKSEVPETVGSRLWFSYATESCGTGSISVSGF